MYIHVHTILQMYVHVCTWYVQCMYKAQYKHICTSFRHVCTRLYVYVLILNSMNMYVQCTNLYIECCVAHVEATYISCNVQTLLNRVRTLLDWVCTMLNRVRTGCSFLFRPVCWPVGWDCLLPGIMPNQVQSHKFNRHQP